MTLGLSPSPDDATPLMGARSNPKPPRWGAGDTVLPPDGRGRELGPDDMFLRAQSGTRIGSISQTNRRARSGCRSPLRQRTLLSSS